jgi:fibronectin type 3 domain-containing protein
MTTASWSPASDVNFGSLKKRHGTILAVTNDEHNAVMESFGYTENLLPADTPIPTVEPEDPDDTPKPTETPTPTPSQTVPGKVTGLSAKSSVSSVTLSWKKTKDADAYIVYRKNAKGTEQVVGTTKKTTYTDKNLLAGRAYSYQVCGVKDNGESQDPGTRSKEVKVLTKPGSTTISSLKKKGTAAVLKFNQAAGATSYQILRYNTKTGKYVPAYKVEGKKLYTYNSKKKKYIKSGTVKQNKKTYTVTLKKPAKGKYVIKTLASAKGYTSAAGKVSKAATLK